MFVYIYIPFSPNRRYAILFACSSRRVELINTAGPRKVTVYIVQRTICIPVVFNLFNLYIKLSVIPLTHWNAILLKKRVANQYLGTAHAIYCEIRRCDKPRYRSVILKMIEMWSLQSRTLSLLICYMCWYAFICLASYCCPKKYASLFSLRRFISPQYTKRYAYTSARFNLCKQPRM